jgi:transposase InsO family protein
VDFVRRWSEKTEISAGQFIGWLDITASKFYDWRERYGNVNEHNGWVPRDFWLEGWEKQAIIERWHKSLKAECICPGTPLSLEDARRLVEGYVEHYNNLRLNSAIGYITPKDMLAGHQHENPAARDRKLEAAREQRKNRRHGVA